MREKQPSLGVGQQSGQKSTSYLSLEEIFCYGGVNPENEDKVTRNIVLVIIKPSRSIMWLPLEEMMKSSLRIMGFAYSL